MIGTNNPGNLRNSFSIMWKGQTGQTRGFCDFDTLDDGARALCIDLKNAQVMHDLNTIATIIPHYAPPNENDTEAYITSVCADMGLDRNESLDLTQQWTLASLASAVWHHEQGQTPDNTAIDYGVAAAMAEA